MRTVNGAWPRARSTAVAVTLGLAATAVLAYAPAAGAVPSPDVVIAEVYGGGGNAGATWTQDFIELGNRGSVEVNLTGWSVQYLPAAPSPTTRWQATPLSGSVAAAGGNLIAEARGTGGTLDLPTPDVEGTISLSAANGTVALVSSTEVLTCLTAADCAADTRIRDLVGYGTAVVRETAPAPYATNALSVARGPELSDTDNNSADFFAGDPTPANSGPPPNRAPSATDDSYQLSEDSPLTVAAPGVLGNDTDADSDALSAALETGPSHGTLALNADGSFTYVPAANYVGPDAFSYRASDGAAVSNPGTVSLTVAQVNDPPTANDDAYTTNKGVELTVAAPGPLANDTDPEGDALSAVLVAPPAHGTVSLAGDGSLAYTPQPGFVGADSFTYMAADGPARSPAATVTVRVLDHQVDAHIRGLSGFVGDNVYNTTGTRQTVAQLALRGTGVPPTFRTADPIGSGPERRSGRGAKEGEIHA